MSKGGGQGSFAQMQEPGMEMGDFGGGVPQIQPFNDQIVRMNDQRETNIQPMPMPLMQNQGPDNINAGLGSKGGRSNPYQTDGIVPPGRTAGLPNQTGGIVPDFMLDRSRGGPKGGGRVYAGGNPNFDERTGEFRTGGIKPPRGPVKLEPIKMQPLPVDTGTPYIPPRQPPQRPTFPPAETVNVPAIPDGMLADLESRGTVGPRSPNPDAPFGMGSKGGRGGGRGMASGIGGKGGRGDPVSTGSFEDMINRGQSSPGSRGNPDSGRTNLDTLFSDQMEERNRNLEEIRARSEASRARYEEFQARQREREARDQTHNRAREYANAVLSGNEPSQTLNDYLVNPQDDGLTNNQGMGEYFPMPMPQPRPQPRFPFFGRQRPPVFGPPRGFPFPPMPGPRPPATPGRNTQFQMPFFGSQYGRMNPYQGQFSGYGVPSNMFSFAQPHYQPYVPPPPQPSPPPVMQLPPGQGGNQVFSGAPAVYTPPPPVSFGGGYGGIGGFGRYNLGLAGSQLR